MDENEGSKVDLATAIGSCASIADNLDSCEKNVPFMDCVYTKLRGQSRQSGQSGQSQALVKSTLHYVVCAENKAKSTYCVLFILNSIVLLIYPF